MATEIRAGIDIGGAFTDLVSIDPDGNIKSVKVDSTVKPEEGVINALKSYGTGAERIGSIVHGQTVVINSIIQRDGAKIGLITTKGFRDILEIQRANRRDIYNLVYKKPTPFVPRYLRQEVDERTTGKGDIIKELDITGLNDIVENFKKEHVDSVAISLINSYVNDLNEKKLKENIIKLGYKYVSASAEITKEWREYERTNTAVLNAFVQPKLSKYVNAVLDGARREGFNGDFRIMLSNGGLGNTDMILNQPILTVESGPVAGIMGALKLSRLALNNETMNIITIDGGSTTTKSSLVYKGLPRINTNYNIGQDKYNSGYPLKIPVIDVVEIGSGGTSMAYIDETGLRVGPRAAGAYPGPACYNRGGVTPTLTDAYLYSGFIDPNYFLGGKMKLHKNLAEHALRTLGQKISLDAEKTAEGIIKLANESASHIIRIISVQKGYDPRDFTLFPYGGAGAMLSPFIADDLGIKRILIPAIPLGVFSAWGMIVSDIRYEKLKTVTLELNENTCNEIESEFSELEREIIEQFKAESNKVPAMIRYGDLRYKGQEHTLKVKLPAHVGNQNLYEIMELFHSSHQKEYTFRMDTNPIELVNIHVVGLHENKEYKIRKWESKGDGKPKGERQVYLHGKYSVFQVYERTNIPTNCTIDGPAIIEEETATSILLENQIGKVDRFGNIIVKTR